MESKTTFEKEIARYTQTSYWDLTPAQQQNVLKQRSVDKERAKEDQMSWFLPDTDPADVTKTIESIENAVGSAAKYVTEDLPVNLLIGGIQTYFGGGLPGPGLKTKPPTKQQGMTRAEVAAAEVADIKNHLQYSYLEPDDSWQWTHQPRGGRTATSTTSGYWKEPVATTTNRNSTEWVDKVNKDYHSTESATLSPDGYIGEPATGIQFETSRSMARDQLNMPLDDPSLKPGMTWQRIPSWEQAGFNERRTGGRPIDPNKVHKDSVYDTDRSVQPIKEWEQVPAPFTPFDPDTHGDRASAWAGINSMESVYEENYYPLYRDTANIESFGEVPDYFDLIETIGGIDGAMNSAGILSFVEDMKQGDMSAQAIQQHLQDAFSRSVGGETQRWNRILEVMQTEQLWANTPDSGWIKTSEPGDEEFLKSSRVSMRRAWDGWITGVDERWQNRGARLKQGTPRLGIPRPWGNDSTMFKRRMGSHFNLQELDGWQIYLLDQLMLLSQRHERNDWRTRNEALEALGPLTQPNTTETLSPEWYGPLGGGRSAMGYWRLGESVTSVGGMEYPKYLSRGILGDNTAVTYESLIESGEFGPDGLPSDPMANKGQFLTPSDYSTAQTPYTTEDNKKASYGRTQGDMLTGRMTFKEMQARQKDAFTLWEEEGSWYAPMKPLETEPE